MSEIKNCPFCDGTNLVCDQDADGTWFVNCIPTQEHGCDAIQRGWVTREIAIKWWNTRAPNAERDRLLEADMHLSAAIHGLIGYTESLEPGTVITQEYVDRLKVHYVAKVKQALADKEGRI